MDSALAIIGFGANFASISLREVAKTAGVVPTSFYRHFGDMEELGLAMVDELGLTPNQTLIAVVIFYVILGMFMETLTMMVATVPIITPVIVALGFDPVWFGVLIMLLIETAMITPPVGINLFVVQGVREHGQLHDVMLGALPFVVTLLVMVVLLILVPDIALWFPALIGR